MSRLVTIQIVDNQFNIRLFMYVFIWLFLAKLPRLAFLPLAVCTCAVVLTHVCSDVIRSNVVSCLTRFGNKIQTFERIPPKIANANFCFMAAGI